MKYTDIYLHFYLATTETNREFGIYSSTRIRLTQTPVAAFTNID